MKTTVPALILAAILSTAIASAQTPAGISGTRPSADGEATDVVVGTYLIDVSKITGSDQSFTADLFVVLIWKDPRLEGVSETIQRVPLESIWNPQVLIVNRRQITKTLPEVAEVAPDGTVTVRQRYFGDFSAPLDLHDFPLDRQTFSFRLVVTGYGPDEVRLISAPREITGEGRAEAFSIPDWDIGEIVVGPEPYQITSQGRAISGYVVSFDGSRHLGFWAGKAFVSVAIIVAMSWVVFWIDPKYIAPRLSVAVTSMLTLIAYRFLLGGVLPRLSYLTRMDYFLIGSTLLVLITVIQVAATTRAEDRDHGRRAHRINLHSRWAFPAAFVILMLVSFWMT
jgi:hypothetical protein